MLAYFEPGSLAEALGLLAEDEDARPLAGGQSLMVLLRQGLVQPARLVSLQAISELGKVETSESELRIGAMVTYREAAESSKLQHLGALQDACRLIGPIPVQNAGTPGGSLCHNAPGADVPPALLALDAEAVVCSRAGERRIPLATFFQGYFETALRPGELLTAVAVPAPQAGSAGAYLKFNYRRIDMALVGVAVRFGLEGGVARNVRLALGGVDSVPFRALAAEAFLEGMALEPSAVREAGRLAAEDRELVSDVHASASYRRRVIPALVRRAFDKALGRI